MLDMVRRRQKPGTGSAHEFLRRRTAVIGWPDLREILKGLGWIIVGDVATRAYMAERMTQDLDILVREADGPEVIARLQKAGYTVVSRLAVPGYAVRFEAVREIVARYSPEDSADLETMIFLGRREMETPPPEDAGPDASNSNP